MIKKTVGLIVLVNTIDKGLVAVLQVRGDFNVEKNEPETYQGASQLTVHGSIEGNESEKEALVRETREELGEEFASLVQGSPLDKLNEIENDNISVVNFIVRINEEDLKKIKGAKIRLIIKDEIKNIRKLKKEDRESVAANDEIAMFKDDIDTVRLAFEKLT